MFSCLEVRDKLAWWDFLADAPDNQKPSLTNNNIIKIINAEIFRVYERELKLIEVFDCLQMA